MPKQGELDYLRNIGDDGVKHACNKPFSDEHCGAYLAEIGSILSLLPAPPARLLDLGCGTGWTSCLFAKRGYTVVGQDIAQDMIDRARANQEKERLDSVSFVVGDYETSRFENEFDAAVFFDSLHHSEDERSALRMAHRALKPGGVCVTSEPGWRHSHSGAAKEAMAKFNVTEKDMPPTHIIRLAKEIGFKNFRVYPHAHHLEKLIYAADPLAGRFRNLRFLVNRTWFKTAAAVAMLLMFKRLSGIVVLTK